jgi:hypothetical protein
MKPLEEGLESILESDRLPNENSAAGQVLAANPALKQEVLEMMDMSRQIRTSFRVPPELEDELAPAPGFYARVMARIEAEGVPQSIWSFFVDPVFGGRLMLASLSLVLLLFAVNYLNSSEGEEFAWNEPEAAEPFILPVDQPLYGAVLVSEGDSFGLPVEESADADWDRGSALMHMAVYHQ